MKRTGRRIPARHRSRRAPPRRPGAKRTSTRKHRQKRNTPGKSWERPGRNWTRPRQNGQRRSRRGLRRELCGSITEAWFYLHNKIHEVEHENVGVEGAHKSELVAEAGARKLTRYAKRRYREHPGPEGGKVGTEGHKSPGQYGFSKEVGLRSPGACQQSAFPCASEMETETPVFQRSKGGCKTGRKGRKENRCRFGNCDPSGGAVCDPSSRGGAGPAPAVAALFLVSAVSSILATPLATASPIHYPAPPTPRRIRTCWGWTRTTQRWKTS